MPKRQPKFVQVALAVIERRGRYLICRRRTADSFGGYWEFPGGKRKPGEAWQSCLRRELREELGVQVRIMGPLGELRHRLGRRRAYFRVFRCAMNGGRPGSLASQTLRWVPASRLGRYRFPPANKPLLVRLAGRLSRRKNRGIIQDIRYTRTDKGGSR